MLTNAKRVASVRAEVYSNLYSLDRDSFLAVLENYPLMRRTMESVAAERLSKIGQNPSIVSNRADLKADLSLVKEIVSSVVDSEGESESEDDDMEEGRKDKEEKGMDRIRRVIQMAKSRKKTLNSDDHTEAVETLPKRDSIDESKLLSVPDPESFRKRSHNRVFGLSSGVSKLFKRGGMFGEQTDNESEAYLSWNRARQQRFTRFRSSIQPMVESSDQHEGDKKHSLCSVTMHVNEASQLIDDNEMSQGPSATDPQPPQSQSPQPAPPPVLPDSPSKSSDDSGTK